MTRLLPALLLLLPLAAEAKPRPAAAPPPPARPPAPAKLAATPAPAQPRPVAPPPGPPAFVPPGLDGLPGGLWRLRFAAEAEQPSATARSGLVTLGAQLAKLPLGRVTLLAQASGPAADVSIARRTTLARGLAVKEALVAGGLAETRIDVRPMGRLPEALDVVDVQPPPPPKPAAPPPPQNIAPPSPRPKPAAPPTQPKPAAPPR